MSKPEQKGIPDVALRMAWADPVQYGEQLLSVGNEPMDFSGQFRFWKEPLRAVCDPDSPRVHVWNKARGVGKTEQASVSYLFNSTTNVMNDGLYAVPRSDQLSSFMKMKVQRKVEGSRRGHPDNPPVLMSMLRGSEVSVKRNEFLPPPEGSGSILQARSAWGDGRAIQEFHGSFGIADEVGQWTKEALSNIMNAIDEPLAGGTDDADQGEGRILLTGTPTFEGTPYHEWWKETDQREWTWACPDCEHSQHTTLENVVQTETNPPNWELSCVACGAEVGKSHIIETGDWKPTNQDGVHRGYRFSRLTSPRHALNELMRSRERATTSKQDFYNYKLARFFSGASKPIPEQAFQRVCDTERALTAMGADSQPYFIGVDFGGGDYSETVVAVVSVPRWRDGGKPYSLRVENVFRIGYDSRTEELRKISEKLERFGLQTTGRCVADLGYGSAHVDALQNGDTRDNAIPEHGYGSRVTGHRFGNVKREQDSHHDWLKWDGRNVVAYKPPWCNDVIDLFPDVQGYDSVDPEAVDWDVQRTQDARISVPYHDDVDTRSRMNWWAKHLTAVKREYKESRESGKKKEFFTVFSEDQRDDGFLALIYAYTAACIGSTSGGGGRVRVTPQVG